MQPEKESKVRETLENKGGIFKYLVEVGRGRVQSISVYR